MSKRFILEPSAQQSGWWVLTDTLNKVVFRFEEHRFNETNKASILEQDKLLQGLTAEEASQLVARIMREMGDWLALHHYGLVFPTPTHEVQYSEDDEHLYIVRNRYPRIRAEILEEDATTDEIGRALKKMGEYIIKRTVNGKE